ncbi:uncharacterized protein LOC124173998 [Ischnura elegans]|uniref:uncharacterized protein LOC124173998 n=1 Tax=Ischnura elegans TaxID=197161 RepID=UPI001ED86E72|nr:uncharacterized protein LOC124173998 [Ischnura elegans]
MGLSLVLSAMIPPACCRGVYTRLWGFLVQGFFLFLHVPTIRTSPQSSPETKSRGQRSKRTHGLLLRLLMNISSWRHHVTLLLLPDFEFTIWEKQNCCGIAMKTSKRIGLVTEEVTA